MRPNGCGFGQFSAAASSSSSMPSTFSMYPNTYYYNNSNMNPYPNLMLPPPPTMNNYTLLDIPTRRATMNELERSSSSRRYGLQHQQYVGNYNNPFKRCTNYNCNTNDTPMWRKGPLGHKTLCNACGIKYRKEEEKRKAKEEASNRKSNNNLG
ncbi:GATA transcription factor 29-like [Mangifera indica]|nr:GATA transcription factor 29-like [Mangifera indica]